MPSLTQDDEEQLINGLRQFKQRHFTCSRRYFRCIACTKVSDHLTYLAEAIIESVVHFAWKQVTQRFGASLIFCSPMKKGFLVVGYGKLGGIELGYQSDLDLVFYMTIVRLGKVRRRNKKLLIVISFIWRLSRKIVSIFSMNTSAGVLYDVDMRLRPSGEAWMLVVH